MASRARLTGGGFAPRPSTNNHSILVCTLSPEPQGLCERRVDNVEHCAFLLDAALTDSCSGSAAHPSPRANLVLWHMHVPLPWHMHLCLRMIDRCRVTRPEQPTAARRFFPLPRTRRSARVATCCGFSAKAQPHHFCYQRIVHELLATYLDDCKPLRPDSLEQTKRLFPSAQPHLSRDTLPLFSSHHIHAFRRAIPGFPTNCFWGS